MNSQNGFLPTRSFLLGFTGALALTCAIATPAQAQTAAFSSAGTYGTAGCGLGSVIFGNSKGIIQIFAATINGTFGTQTFGITSGTSNCATTHQGTVSAKAFVETNRETLAKDIARGSGETIANLSAIAGCRDVRAVGSALQGNFSKIFPSASVSDVSVGNSVVKSLKANSHLNCRKLS